MPVYISRAQSRIASLVQEASYDNYSHSIDRGGPKWQSGSAKQSCRGEEKTRCVVSHGP